jgi:tetratricopeptide (TPR) repeat protein
LLEVQKGIDPRKEPALTVLLLAQACAAVGDTAGAEKLLRRATTARPDQVVLLDALGKLLERTSRLEEAIGYYRSARGQRPRLGIALSRALLVAGKTEEAEEVLEELVLRHADERNPAFFFYLGVVRLRQHRYGEAEAAYRKALRLKRDWANAYSNLSVALSGQQKYSQAEAACRKAIHLKPDCAAALLNLANALQCQGEHTEAEAACRKALGLKPDYAEAYTNLGNALLAQGKFGAGEAAYRKALALKPDLAEAHVNLGNIWMAQKRYGKAEAAYRKGIRLKPDSAEAYSNLGAALISQKKYGQAEAACRKALELRPDLPQAYQGLGTVLLAQGKHREAELLYRKAIDLKPDFAAAHNNLGTARTAQQRYAEAEAAHRKAIALEPRCGLAYRNLGIALMQQARFDEAAAALKKAGDLLAAKDCCRVQARRLRRQCQRYVILDARLPAILRGKEKPSSTAEQIEFALLCIHKKHDAAAARFFRAAFTAEPQLSEMAPAGTRYMAGRAAARAGCGQGKDADRLDDKERALWRRQALEWLRQDLAGWERALDKGDAQTNTCIRVWMRYWQADASLASVRDKDALTRLPVKERKKWEGLWSAVDTLLQRAGKPE